MPLAYVVCILLSFLGCRASAQLLSLSADDVNFTVNSMVYLTCNVTVNLTLLSAQETLLQLSIEHLSVKLESKYISLYGYAENETSIFEDFIKWNSTLDLSDAGVYLCRAQIGINKQTVSFNVAEQGFQLIVQPLQDKNTSLNELVHFQCLFNHDSVHISWRRNNDLLSSSSKIFIESTGRKSLLNISNANFDDIATYSCTGRLQQYSNRTEAYLTIKEYVPLYINSERYNEHHQVSSTRTGAVSCDIEGIPTPTYTWSKGNQTIPSILSFSEPYVAENGSLIIANAAPSNSGNYTCYAIQELRIDTTRLSLTYSINIEPHKDESSIGWYIYVIVGIAVITIILMIAVACYFIAANSDICIEKKNQRMRKMQKKMRKQLKSQEVADDEFGFYVPNPQHEYNEEEHEEEWNDNELIKMTNEAFEESPTNIDNDLENDDDTSYQGTFVRKHTPPNNKKKTKTAIEIEDTKEEEEEEEEEEDTSSYQGTFVRKKTPPSRKKDTPSNPSSYSKLPPAPQEEIPNSSIAQSQKKRSKPSARPTPVVKNVPVVHEQGAVITEAPKQEDDGTYYTETVYTPPLIYDYEDDDEDDDMIEEELKRALIPPNNRINTDTSPLETAQAEQKNDDAKSESEEDSSYDMKKIMEQHTATKDEEAWPFKPQEPIIPNTRLVSAPADPEIIQSETKPQKITFRRSSFEGTGLVPDHEKYPSPPQGRRRSFHEGLQRRHAPQRHDTEVHGRNYPEGYDRLSKRRSSDSHILRSHKARKNSDPETTFTRDKPSRNEPTENDTEKEKKRQQTEAKKEAKKREKGSKKHKKGSSFATADVIY